MLDPSAAWARDGYSSPEQLAIHWLMTSVAWIEERSWVHQAVSFQHLKSSYKLWPGSDKTKTTQNKKMALYQTRIWSPAWGVDDSILRFFTSW